MLERLLYIFYLKSYRMELELFRVINRLSGIDT